MMYGDDRGRGRWICGHALAGCPRTVAAKVRCTPVTLSDSSQRRRARFVSCGRSLERTLVEA